LLSWYPICRSCDLASAVNPSRRHNLFVMAETDAERAAREQREKAAADAEAERARQAERALVITNAQALTTSLHAQAVAVQNLRDLVPIVLDRHSTQYSQWCGLFLNTLGKYALADHVNLDAAPQDIGDWDAMECTVRSWMYASITPNLLSDVMMPGASTRRVWLAIEDQFLSNKETRALILDAEFRNFVQGDLPIADYCRKLKSMADSLGDLGEPVLDRTLVLSVLRGLDEKFGYMGVILKR
jgi:hypothetical protein